MIAITGAGGFIGSVLVSYLNKQGITDLVLFDDLPSGDQFKNLVNKEYISLHSSDEIFSSPEDIDCVIHLGADSSTLTRDWNSLYKTNVLSTRKWNSFCSSNGIPFIFASSAAVYGNGNGPLNHYAFSKQTSEAEIDGVVLRLFNVYGPNEYHKGRMASTIYHWFNQLSTTGSINVFEDSDKFSRDFIYVEDVAKIIHHFIDNYEPGLYDVGTGIAVDFESLANEVTASMQEAKNYIPMPADLKNQYQVYTCADTSALASTGFDIKKLKTVEQGISIYLEYFKSQSLY